MRRRSPVEAQGSNGRRQRKDGKTEKGKSGKTETREKCQVGHSGS